MIRSTLAVALVSIVCLFSFTPELVLSLYPPRPGTLAPFTLRADRRLSLPALDGTEAPETSEAPRVVDYRAGEVVVPFLKVLDGADVRRIEALTERQGDAFLARTPLALFLAVWAVGFLGTFLLALPRGGYRRAASPPLLLALLIVQTVTVTGMMRFTAWPVQILPVALLPFLVVAMAQGRITAVGATAAGILIGALAVGRSWETSLTWLVAGLTAVMAAPKRLGFASALRAGLLVGLVQVILLLLAGEDWRGLSALVPPPDGMSSGWFAALAAHPAAVRSAWALAAGLLSGGMALVLFPFLSAGRTIGSTLSLRRFSDLDQPLLKRLFAEAPGTYQHCMNVAYLAQAAGDAIGANPLLLRIGAYFHDIGKVTRPEGYVENQVSGDNLHDRIDPYESIAIIHGHLTGGVRIAREARLPGPVIDLIEQHHGTQVVDYFYQKAHRLKSREPVREQDFRYPGPKPRTIEAALLMIADAVEAASRTLKAPGRPAFDKLVRFIIVKRIADGQFAECILDTRDIEAITLAMVDALEASFHTRIRYPWQQGGSSPQPAVRRAG